MSKLLEFRNEGIYCPQADFYIDPWKSVANAVITHAHSDHARSGMANYLCHSLTAPMLRHRLSKDISIQTLEYSETLLINGVKLTLHPAGHIIGSAQVRLEYKGEVWVVSGDYKTQVDPFANAFEPVPCHTFITESTFGLPVYSWKSDLVQQQAVLAWWQNCISEEKTPVILAYSLGKAQRILAMLKDGPGPVYSHGAVFSTNQILRESGIAIPTDIYAGTIGKQELAKNAIILAPPAADQSIWLKKFGNVSVAHVSGWMTLRGAKRRRNAEKGFAISDHADWNGLNYAVKATGAECVYVTHGYSSVFAAWLTEQGIDAKEIKTEFEGEADGISDSKSWAEEESK